MTTTTTGPFSKRERQLMDALYRLGEGSAADVARALGEEDAYHTIRVTLRNLEKKGHVRHVKDGRVHVYRPVEPRSRMRRTALRHLTRTYFGGSRSRAILTFFDESVDLLSDEEIAEIRKHIEQASRSRRG
ncbi:MAG: BlaI/MecI/CopY family transcriptional regulator [Gemmatimonadota bacterium]